MRTTYSVSCMMCGRMSGHLHDGAFTRLPNTPALDRHAGEVRCGFCGGSLYLELDDSVAASLATEQAIRQAQAGRRLAS